MSGHQSKSSECALVFWSIKSALFAKYILQEGYRVENAYYGDCNIMFRLFRTVMFNISKKSASFWYNRRLIDFEGVIIVFDSMITLHYLKWLLKKNPKARVIFCYWNPISRARLPIEEVKKTRCEIWSYGEQCQTYGIKQNESFYLDEMYKKALSMKEKTAKYDVIFVGKDKGRLDALKKMVSEHHWDSLNWFWYICPDHFWQIFKKKEYKKQISYSEAQVLQVKSKALLELMPSALQATTMRTFDALILQKKLITNNLRACELPFYHPDNVFILGKDKDEDLPLFLEKPYARISGPLLNEYSFDKWIDRILKDTPINQKSQRSNEHGNTIVYTQI